MDLEKQFEQGVTNAPNETIFSCAHIPLLSDLANLPFPFGKGGADFHGRVSPGVKRRNTFSGPALSDLCGLCGKTEFGTW